MPSWKESKDFEELANKAWNVTLYSYFEPEIIKVECYNTNFDIQKEHWDKMLIFHGAELPKRIELKTRTAKYYEKFSRDQTLVFETIGNMERNTQGSSVFNSYAEYWGYGFYIPHIHENRILAPKIFHRQELADHLQKNIKKFKIGQSNTDNELYHTQFIFVPMSEVERFKVRNTLKFW